MTALVRTPAEGQLIRLEEAKARLAQVVKVDEAKKIRDQAEAIRHYAKEQRLGLALQNSAAEVKIRAERRGGEILSAVERADHAEAGTKGGHAKAGTAQPAQRQNYSETIEAAGIKKDTAQRWQLEASLPEPQFEILVATAKATDQELTSTAVQRMAVEAKGDPLTEIKKKAKASPPVKFSKYVGNLYKAAVALTEEPVKEYARKATGSEKKHFLHHLGVAKKAIEDLYELCGQ